MECKKWNINEVLQATKRRNVVCTVKLTPEERHILDQIQQVAGLDSISDAIRVAVKELWTELRGGNRC